jgi:glutamate synthase domain-containing protein 1
MCGIVGLLIKNPKLRPQLGQLMLPMLIGMTERGPDSAGLAAYTSKVAPNERKFSLYAFDEDFNWHKLGHDFQAHLGTTASVLPQAKEEVGSLTKET